MYSATLLKAFITHNLLSVGIPVIELDKLQATGDQDVRLRQLTQKWEERGLLMDQISISIINLAASRSSPSKLAISMVLIPFANFFNSFLIFI